MGQRLWFLGTIVLFVGALAILIAAYASAYDGVADAVPVLTLLIAIPSFLSLVLQILLSRRLRTGEWKAQGYEELDVEASLLPSSTYKVLIILLERSVRPTVQSAAIIIGPGIALFAIIFLRLTAGVDNFQGDPAYFDFGPKYGIDGGEPNISFSNEFTSYGHCLQGVLAAMFSFPAVSGLLTQILTLGIFRKTWWTECNKPVWSLIQLMAVCMCIYPIYNFVKRAIRSWEVFASSSYCNNSFEWAWGFLVGLALGNLLTILIKLVVAMKLWRRRQLTEDVLKKSEGQPWILGMQEPARFQIFLNGVQWIIGLCFMASVVAAAALIGVTWHNCLEGTNDCVNRGAISPEVVVVFVMVPMVTIIVVACTAAVRLNR